MEQVHNKASRKGRQRHALLWTSILPVLVLFLSPSPSQGRRHSIRSEVGVNSGYIRELDKEGFIEHPLQIIHPKKLRDARTRVSGEPTLDVSATTFSNRDTIVVTLHNEGGNRST